MHIALYNKYRSKTFDDVQGQDHITSVLKYQVQNDRVSHAYLFCGSRGTGKTSCAKILARVINCENPVNGNPCGKCASCVAIERGVAPDVVEMDAASDRKIEDIRTVIDEVQYRPVMLKKRVYIIDEVHMLTTEAFNAILKTLEEPPEYVVFILATTEVHKLLPTIISRCQRFDFHRINIDVIADRLEYIAKNENIVIEHECTRIIAKLARGGMRDAISMFELCSGGGADITAERVKNVLGYSGYEKTFDTVKAIADKNMGHLFEIIRDIYMSSTDISVFFEELIEFNRDMLVAKNLADPASYLDVTDDELKILNEAAGMFTLAALYNQSFVLDNAVKDMDRLPHIKRTVAEFAFAKLCDLSLDSSTPALCRRIEELESKVRLLQSNLLAASSGKNVPAPEGTSRKEDEPASADNGHNGHNGPDGSGKNISGKEKPLKKESAGTASDARKFFSLLRNADFFEKLGESDKTMVAPFLQAADIFELSEDGEVCRISPSNPILSEKLKNEETKTDIGTALITAGLTDKKVSIVVLKKSSAENNGGNIPLPGFEF